ncbi:concanavalin A-like lectin/glucanase domain-containing protein [Mycena olivaceomarginata]|nr:concanavalin A-like lectin/glucanase domain-containing protein [Mycena olivaceomarginata]
MSPSGLLLLAALLPVALSQLVGTNMAENHPTLTWQKCTGTGGTSCTTQSSSIVIDANWRWTHQGATGTTNCYTGNTWDATLCPDGKTCAANCAVDGTYGITTNGNSLTMKFVTVSQQPNIGSRVYLLAPGSHLDKHLILKGHRFDVDVSQLPCGLNGALYFAQMDADGGVAKSNGANKAGPKYGTGYCDAQCPRDIKFINGVANSQAGSPVRMIVRRHPVVFCDGGTNSSPAANAGTVRSCCPEMDVWISSAYTPHSCTTLGQSTCTGSACSAPNSTQGTCDQAGCDFNSYRMGVTNFYGPGMTVDTNHKDHRRHSNGRVIPNSNSTIAGVTGNAITDSFCAAQKSAFGDTNTFASKGGLATMSRAASAGMVLVMSIWDDHAANMLWLDAPYPPNKSASAPGVTRGTCAANSGAPTTVESQNANAQVTYSNIKFGPIGSTFNAPA